MTAIQDTTYWTCSYSILLQCYCIRYYNTNLLCQSLLRSKWEFILHSPLAQHMTCLPREPVWSPG